LQDGFRGVRGPPSKGKKGRRAPLGRRPPRLLDRDASGAHTFDWAKNRSPDAARLTSGLFWLENRGVSDSSAGAGVPGRSREQRLRALEHANEVRTARAALKKELASGKVELVQILADPPPCVRTARVRDLLLVLPKIGSVRAARILAHCGIAHSKTLAGLTERQRGELITFFRA
jgi:hypothetical protein